METINELAIPDNLSELEELAKKYRDKVGTDLHKPLVGIYTDIKQRNTLLEVINIIDMQYRKTQLPFLLYLKDMAIAGCNIADTAAENENDPYKKGSLYESINMTIVVTLSKVGSIDLERELDNRIIRYTANVGLLTFILAEALMMVINSFSPVTNIFISIANGLVCMFICHFLISTGIMEEVNETSEMLDEAQRSIN